MKKVLIAEDDPLLLKILSKTLRKYSDIFEIVLVSDGKEAIDVLKEAPVDLVVTDIQMPQINGLILLAYVNTYHPSIPCIVTTSYGTSRLKAKLPEELLHFFQKPFKGDDLAKVIVSALARNDSIKAGQGISVMSFLSMIEMHQFSCVFEIRSSGKPTGVLYFKNGVLYDAQCGDLIGETAALELIARERATYQFKGFPKKEVVRRIKTDLRSLIFKDMDTVHKPDSV